MPCRDYESDYINQREINDQEVIDLKERLDQVTKLLCFVMGNINEGSWYKTILHNWEFQRGNEDLEIEVIKWWTEHQRLDEEERIQHLEENARERRKVLILQKLHESFGAEEIEELKELL